MSAGVNIRIARLVRMISLCMFGVMMFISQLFMEFLPNIHPVAMFIILLTVVYRKQALISIYIYVFLEGFFGGFNIWWVPYLYIWTLLWGAAMLLPKNMSVRVKAIVYPILAALSGITFGALYAPVYALLTDMTFEQTLVWIGMGASFDIIHAIGNAIMGLLVLPLEIALRRIEAKYKRT